MSAAASAEPLPAVKRNVVSRKENDDHFAVDMDTGEIYDLNESAAFILDACRRGGGTFDTLLDEMSARYPDVPREELARDARELIEEMRKTRLVA